MISYSSMLYADNETVTDTSDIDFIEFLGNWETDDGTWIDPNKLAADQVDQDQTGSDRVLQPDQTADPKPDKPGAPSVTPAGGRNSD